MKQHYDKFESMTDEQRRKYLDARLVKVVARAYRGAPAAREMMQNAGVRPSEIKTASDLAKLPITRKPDLIEMQQKNLPYGGYYIGKIIDIELGDYSRCQIKETSSDSTSATPLIKHSSEEITGERLYGSLCPECSSTRMVQNGTCKVCLDCGATTGCS